MRKFQAGSLRNPAKYSSVARSLVVPGDEVITGRGARKTAPFSALVAAELPMVQSRTTMDKICRGSSLLGAAGPLKSLNNLLLQSRWTSSLSFEAKALATVTTMGSVGSGFNIAYPMAFMHD